MDYNGNKETDTEKGFNQPVEVLTYIDARFGLHTRGITERKWSKINWFLDKLEPIETGIYKFKTISKVELIQSMLLLY